jgi:hypothetical protein
MRRGEHASHLAYLFLTMIVVSRLSSASTRNEVFPSAVDLEGKQVQPLAAALGKVVVLIFMRADCPISNRYAPTIQQLSAHYGDKIGFWLVYPDKAASSAAIRKQLQDYGYKIPALRDPEHTLAARSHVEVTPEAAVFDTTGRLVYHGRIDNWYQQFGRSRPQPTTHELADAIEAALNGRTPAAGTVTPVGCYISDLE